MSCNNRFAALQESDSDENDNLVNQNAGITRPLQKDAFIRDSSKPARYFVNSNRKLASGNIHPIRDIHPKPPFFTHPIDDHDYSVSAVTSRNYVYDAGEPSWAASPLATNREVTVPDENGHNFPSGSGVSDPKRVLQQMFVTLILELAEIYFSPISFAESIAQYESIIGRFFQNVKHSC